jgi:hypothetical protein
MMRTTYEAIQDLLVHLEGWNPPVRARLIAEAGAGWSRSPTRVVAWCPRTLTSKQEKPNEPAHR